MNDIVVFGCINLDIIVKCDKFPINGTTAFCQNIAMMPGGKGNNQAVSAAHYGKKVRFIGCVGDDGPGKQLRQNLQKRHIDDTYLIIKPSVTTGSCVALLEPNGENTLLVNRGANFSFTQEDITQFSEAIEGKILLIQMETNKEPILAAMRIAKEKGLFVILDPAPVQGIAPECFAYADLIVPNSEETHHITGIMPTDEASALAAAKQIYAMGVKRIIIKMGAKGCLFYQNEQSVFIPALKVKAVDTVGAGDCFAGMLANYLIDKPGDLEGAIRFAQVVAGIKVSRFGGHDAIPSLAEVQAVINAS